MDPNAMKNMVVLKNLPSNMVEEAFIVFKDNVKIHKLQKVEKNKIKEKDERTNKEGYMIKEAEMIVQDFISKIEKKEYELVNGNKKINEKYKRLKYLTIFLAIFSVLSVCSILLR